MSTEPETLITSMAIATDSNDDTKMKWDNKASCIHEISSSQATVGDINTYMKMNIKMKYEYEDGGQEPDVVIT